MKRRLLLNLTLTALGWTLHSTPGCTSPTTAAGLLKAAGVVGGVVVQLGCGDGALLPALHASDAFTVQGLEADPAQVAAAKRRISALGLSGDVSVRQFAGTRLPYANDLVDLVVVTDPGRVSREETLRIVAPGGALIDMRSTGAGLIRKPWPEDIDQWTHFLHDAGNNAVARDTRVGPPRSLQWVAPPKFLRSHETPSGFQALVTANGRMFYLFDEGLIGITDQRLPERWALICRDAFNGRFLWRRPLEKWGWTEWAADRFGKNDWTRITGGRTVVPEENQRRLVAEGERLYATLSYAAPLSILDAATGQVRTTIPETEPVRQLLVSEGAVVVYSSPLETEPSARRGEAASASAWLSVVDTATERLQWKREVGAIRGLGLAVDQGRIVYQSGRDLSALDLQTGKPLWQVQPQAQNPLTIVAHDGAVVLLANKLLEARDGATGRQLWQKRVTVAGSAERQDLFVIDGVIWPGMLSVDDALKIKGKTANALALGYDLRSGEEVKRVVAQGVRSPEHHHRCYRNKATSNYLISGLEGCEFVSVTGKKHSQNNYVRGACRFGILPANGLLYVPTDQCFCEPGAKLLGTAALATERPARLVPASQRLERGPAYGEAAALVRQSPPQSSEWPTYRQDPARHGSVATTVAVTPKQRWRVKLGPGLTQPVSVGDRLYAAAREAHTVYALDAANGREVWRFVADGRVDSPPTVLGGALLFGSADGQVYCLRATDGKLVWRFLAAPEDRQVVAFDQLESAWPVHGSVVVRDGLAYFTAGRSTYLDGGIRVYALDPATGAVRHETTLSGPYSDGSAGDEVSFYRDGVGQPFPESVGKREVSFYILGANSDVLVSEGDSLYMRQKRLTPDLKEVRAPVLSTKGEQDVGLHVFSTASLLDGSWYNRTFWMYAKRWPGFQLANQAPKSGQLLVVDEANTYAVHPFYHRNVHSPMFFPGKEGYLLYADKNSTEPQIVGEEGSRPPLEWLPQSGYARRDGERKLDSPAFGLDKMIGYTRADPPLWKSWLPVRMRAMVKAGDTLFVAGPPDEFDPADPYAPFEGRKGALLVAVRASDGRKLAVQHLDTPPAFDGLSAANGRLFAALEDGSLACFGG